MFNLIPKKLTILVPYLVGLDQMSGTQKISLKLIAMPKL